MSSKKPSTELARIAPTAEHLDHARGVGEYFDTCYSQHERYWWRRANDENVLSPNPNDYPTSLVTSTLLREIGRRGIIPANSRVLSFGAGEGVDEVRLAKMGFTVDAIDVSLRGIEKMLALAQDQGVAGRVRGIQADVQTYTVDEASDIVLCNGLLDYIPDPNKASLIAKMQQATKIGGLDVITTWIDFPRPDIPPCHNVVPMYPDLGFDITNMMYGSEWERALYYLEWDKLDFSHPEGERDPAERHSHSHGKLIAALA